MKRILSILVTVSMMLMLMVPAQAAGEATVTIESAAEAVGIGEEVTLAVSAANNPGFTNFEYEMGYDSDCLELVDFDTTFLSGLIMDSNTSTGIVAAIGANAFTEADATLFTVTFRVKDTATAGNTVVTINPILMENLGTPVVFTYEWGTVEIAGDPSGSVPSGSLPSGSLPSGSLPSGSLPSGSLPSGSLPSGSLPSGSLPSGGLPEGDFPIYADDDDVTSLGGEATQKFTVKFENNGGDGILSVVVEKNGVVEEPEEPVREGFEFAGWYVDEGLTKLYNFNTLVTKSFTLYAKWVEEGTKAEFPFEDVEETDWFYEAVKFAFEKNFVNGVSANEFAPDDNVTRAALVAILYRLEGEPATNRSIPFADVAMDKYYANAIIWAEQNEIVKGISETEFAPEVDITREQIATIIYRYAKYNNYDLSAVETADLSSFNDADQISDYAVDAMKYAVGNGLIRGRSNAMLAPNDYASRAEFAQILYNFFK